MNLTVAPQNGMVFKDRSKLPSKIFMVIGIERVVKGGIRVKGVAVDQGGAPRQITLTGEEFASTYPLVFWSP